MTEAEFKAHAADAVLFLAKVVNDPTVDMPLRVDAAICLASSAALPADYDDDEVQAYNKKVEAWNAEAERKQ